MRLVSDDTWGILTVWCEARGEPYEGKVGVAEVILNRTRLRYQSNGTVGGTVLRPMQFSCWSTHDPNRLYATDLDDDDPIVQVCAAAWREAKTGTTTVQGALLYFNPDLCSPSWVPSCREVAVIGHQHFMVPR